MANKGEKTRPFKPVSYSSATLARQKQKREYEKQKREKIIFSLFVVIILVMILFAILVFKNVLSNENPSETESDFGAAQSDTESGTETDPMTAAASAHLSTVVAKSDVYKGSLLLIDAAHPFRADKPTLKNAAESREKFENPSAKNGYAFSFYVGNMNTVLLEEQALAALNEMANDFYRQTGVYDLYIPEKSAYAEGTSDSHATGRAFDLLAWPGGNTYLALDDASQGDKFASILDGYHKYGFIRETCDNSGLHLLYVGVPHASYITGNQLTLSSYLTKLRTEHAFSEDGANHLVFTAEDGNRYEVYYVEASGDMVSLPIPTDNGEYTISGDNQNGFVVTVTLK